MMPDKFCQALGLGRPGQMSNSKSAKILWDPRTINLTTIESEFISDLLYVLDDGFKTPLLSVSNTKKDRADKHSELEVFLEKNESVILSIFPLLKNKEQDTALHDDATSVEGEYHYRLAFFEGKDLNIICDTYYILFDNNYNKEDGYPKDFWKDIEAKRNVLFWDISTPPATQDIITPKTSTNLSDEAISRLSSATWLPEAKNLFENVVSNSSKRAKMKDNRVVLPHERYHYRYRLLEESERPLHTKTSDAFQKIKQKYTSYSVILSNVFENCTFSDQSINFYSDDLSGITLSNVTGKGYVEGDLSNTSYRDKSNIELNYIANIDFNGSHITDGSTVTIKPFDNSTSKITINATEIDVFDSTLDAHLGSEDIISFAGSKLKKSMIMIADAKKVDFSNAEFEECEIIVKSVSTAAFKEANFKSSKITIESEDIDCSGAIISGQNDVNIIATTAVFKDASIAGRTKLQGQVENMNFKLAKIGDNILSSEDRVSYSLQAAKINFDQAEFGNILFSDTSKTETAHTDWSTIRITGRIGATGEIAKALYPLFGQATNMWTETKPPEHAGNDAHPSRSFDLDVE